MHSCYTRDQTSNSTAKGRFLAGLKRERGDEWWSSKQSSGSILSPPHLHNAAGAAAAAGMMFVSPRGVYFISGSIVVSFALPRIITRLTRARLSRRAFKSDCDWSARLYLHWCPRYPAALSRTARESNQAAKTGLRRHCCCCCCRLIDGSAGSDVSWISAPAWSILFRLRSTFFFRYLQGYFRGWMAGFGEFSYGKQ